MGIGKRIKEKRELLGYNQEQLANIVGVTKSAIGNYENEVSHPKEPILYKLFDALKCDANYLFQDELNNNSKDIFSIEEIKLINDYRVLDIHGKQTVSVVIKSELERCKYNKKEEENNEKIQSRKKLK